MKAVLGLEDGNYFVGEGFGVEGTGTGELVFTTQMTGYMEALTDPSYAGQILMFTYPLIGNYGVDFDNFQNPHIHARGCVVQEICRSPKHAPSLVTFFEDQGLSGISGVDTRMLTINTRIHGTLRSALIVGDDNGELAVDLAKKAPQLSDQDLIRSVTCTDPYRVRGKGKRIAVLDLGVKKNIIVSLRKRDADIYIYPATATKEEIDACRPEALFISNGPGDPARAATPIQTVKSYIGEIPIFGICMGNQILARALGAETRKMKFGHRGSNQPVRALDGSIHITTQNHGYVVDGETLPEGCEISYVNVNDNSLEGFSDTYLNIYSVQFHPEAYGGPQDTEQKIFDKIYRSIPDA
ncbi:MAG: carbamoyl-phosphate synthase small subunit [Methanocalculus sp. MSAO_Arc1]|uniref:glutamine-hydrolyzing carbamoyl-phosphate synthase small subunit n=1 Tax=Methanocalculus TaxID=71151 RepID=UPI000FF11FD3|nr:MULTISPECIES: glutamine-hydrolyzing carbamoyl-phosphate synthase small subunit [unclassified Methanocalculus]MCP1661800.1 carbamoyl-phosphate synthase small subunit [Methanocalculus sp. AMF5]RQD80192.1 MAG: carbamoyl-phosphate synthase small subunit [Methanocalculus sp. MSAO_Arc1]